MKIAGLVCNLLGTFILAFSVGKNKYSCEIVVNGLINSYCAVIYMPVFYTGLAFIAIGFILQFIESLKK